MDANEYLAQLLRLRDLIVQAARTERSLYRAGADARDSAQKHRLDRARCRALDRLSRREDAYRRLRDGLPAIATPTVSAWMLANIAEYARGLDGVDNAEIAGAACDALGLWDEHGSIPGWVWRLGEWASVHEEEERLSRLALRDIWVEKAPLNFEDDGWVVFA